MNKLSRWVVGFAFTMLFCLAVAVSTVAAQASMVVVPNDLATVEGNRDNGYPFNITHFDLSSIRYQQVYAMSDFASLSGPQRITQIAFRPNADPETVQAFESTIPSIEIRLSTTTKAPDELSLRFDDNVGADDTVVFAGALSLSSSFTGPVLGPKDFDIVINLQTPFIYDRTAGNLLLDVRVFSGASTTFFDGHDDVDAVSRTFSSLYGSVNDPYGGQDGFGLVTRFTTAAVANVPRSKGDCKNDGWRTLTRADGSTFKNQGDCIQYINTGK